ncbi:MAG: hypothetical protein P8012_12805 [Desulfobacterales bacterium]
MKPLFPVSKKLFLWLGLPVAVITFLISGCSRDSEYTPVDFSKTIKIEKSAPLEDKAHTLRVAVSAMVSPKETFSTYRNLLDYLGDHLNYKIKLIQRKTYGEINELFLLSGGSLFTRHTLL